MPNTYTQIHIQFVFAVKSRKAVIHASWKEELYKYISEIISSNSHKVLAINGVEDHIHILIGYRPTQAMSDLIQQVKQSSSKWINNKGFLKSKFEWQQGFGAFSYSKTHVDRVINYINNQEEHHKKKAFLAEYELFLKKFNVDYDKRYIFKELA